MRGRVEHYWGSLLFTAVCLVLGAWYGFASSGSIEQTFGLLWIILVLAVLEISLSFDNAVVNASVLKDMDEVWQQRFLTWGMAIAVFGMRVAFPLAIVGIAAHLGPVAAVNLSLNEPERYEAIVSSAHVGIAGFGGAFLLMVGLSFFVDEEKDVHWLGKVEQILGSAGGVPAAHIGLLLLGLWAVSAILPDEEALTFLVAGLLGIVAFIAVEGIGELLQRHEESKSTGAAVRSGLGGFLYLQVLDSSFSFDGVIGAFALSNNMVVIALGLSIGAMFVRSMTIMLVKRGTLTEFRFLEHGAFWAILALGVIMLLSARFEIPEAVTGLIGAVLIGLSLWWSVRTRGDDGFEPERVEV